MTDDRYARQQRFPPIGVDGQRRIAAAHVLVVGVGALGSHVADLLARAGTGRLTLVDRDVVEPSNLQRQVLFDERDAREGRPKAVAAAEALARANSSIRIEPIAAEFDVGLWSSLDAPPDVVVDGTDHFGVRLLINDLAILHDLPWVHGAALGATGRAMTIVPGTTPCLRCLLPAPPPTAEIGTCETAGVIATAIAHVAAFQTSECLKLITHGTPTRGMFTCDAWEQEFAIKLRHVEPDPECASCGLRLLPELERHAPEATPLCGRDAVQVRPRAGGGTIDLDRLAERVRDVAHDLVAADGMLRFATDDARFSVFRSGRAIVFGTRDPKRARILFDRYIGA